MKYPPGDREIIDFTHLGTEILSIEEEVEGEEVEVEEEGNGYKEDKLRGLTEELMVEMDKLILEDLNH